MCDSLFEKKHDSWCLFIAHLVLEKTLKALWISEHYPEPHPRIHNLEKLARRIPIHLTEDQKKFLVKVNDFYLLERYSEEKEAFRKICTVEFASNNLKEIKGIFINGS
ncbi:HEPN domain-containing protein [candidate division KSB1 bacterium]|nr:HEPN domain-containing protein [candidate division KSB1 bacterium]